MWEGAESDPVSKLRGGLGTCSNMIEKKKKRKQQFFIQGSETILKSKISYHSTGHIGSRNHRFPKSGFLHLGIIDTLSSMILCCGGPSRAV